jgi:hypothetical protein
MSLLVLSTVFSIIGILENLKRLEKEKTIFEGDI